MHVQDPRKKTWKNKNPPKWMYKRRQVLELPLAKNPFQEKMRNAKYPQNGYTNMDKSLSDLRSKSSQN